MRMNCMCRDSSKRKFPWEGARLCWACWRAAFGIAFDFDTYLRWCCQPENLYRGDA